MALMRTLSPLCILSATAIATLLVVNGEKCWGDNPGPPAGNLVTVEQVQRRLDDLSWRILDARRLADYRRGHIPGAVHVDVDRWMNRTQEPTGLKDDQYWSQAIAGLGINQTTGVIVYADKLTTTARIWWLLAYLGVPRVAVFDGDWSAWERAGLPVEAETPSVVAGDFRTRFSAGWLVETDQLQRSLERGEAQIVDARSAGEYSGQRGIGGQAGRVPGAIHLDWLEVLDDQGGLRKPGELERLLQARGISPSQRQIIYCHSGMRSSVVLLALREAGFEGASNYYGGWQRWRTTAGVPMAGGTEQ